MNTLLENRSTALFLDSGDPTETRESLKLLGFLDGQTTNPSLIAKNPEVQEFLKTQKFSRDHLLAKYQEIAIHVHDVIPNGKISVEVYVAPTSLYQDVLDQAHIMATWFPGVYIKLPITEVGLQVASQLVSEGINVNMTLCFSQEQAAAVHTATKHATTSSVFVSPFVGRLDDIGENGIDLIKNIHTMYQSWGSHVGILGASIRTHAHIAGCQNLGIAAMTIPFKLIESIVHEIPEVANEAQILTPIEYKELPVEESWDHYVITHPLTSKGLDKFVSDWNSLSM